VTATCTVDSKLRVTGATEQQCERLIEGSRVMSPDYLKALRGAMTPWRMPPKWIAFGERVGDAVVMSRGFTSLVREVVPGVQFIDQRLRVAHAHVFDRQLRGEQRACIEAIVRATQGGIVGPPGMGKSSVVMGAVAELAQVAAIVVPTLPILGQFERDIFDLMHVRAAVIGEGREEAGPITLCTAASLRDEDRRARLHARVGAMFVDECHAGTGPETRAILDNCPAWIRCGVTATWPTDERAPIMAALFGRVIHRLDTSALVDLGRLTKPEYRQVRTGFRGHGSDFGALVDATTQDEARNALAIDTIVANCGPGRLGLALFGRVAHAEQFPAELRARGLRAEVLTGAVRKAERERILAAARAGDIDVLCATSLADEGLDVPLIARVFLIAPQKAGGRFVQRIGRAMRPAPGKPTPIVFDFADVQSGLLAHQARGRARAFADLWRGQGMAA
jgi:superfamily II DNA or RNA helicase